MSKLLTGDVKTHLIRRALPGVAGAFAMMVFNLTDTLFVSRLGTEALAAMGFTFAVVMIVGLTVANLIIGPPAASCATPARTQSANWCTSPVSSW